MGARKRKRQHGTGGIYKRGRSWLIKWHEADGRQRYKSFAREDLARLALAKITRDVAAGEIGLADPSAPKPGDIIFDEMADTWLKSRRHHRTHEDERLRLKKHLRPIFGSRRLREITTTDIDAFLTSKLDEIAPATVKQLRFILARMYQDAIRWELAASSPVASAQKVRVEHSHEQFEYLTKDEMERLIVCEAVPFAARALYATAVLAGLRMGELYCLEWGDVDLERRQIAVRRSFKGPTKSGKPRFVPVHPQLAAILAQLKLLKSGPLVFPNAAGEQRSRFHLYGFRAHLAAAGCKKIRFHDLRHTCASFYVSQGTPLRTVQAILGHASITTTERYAHLAPQYAHAEVDRVRLNLELGQVVRFERAG